ncbi:MAG: hypothetical protein O2865_05995 [Planctomycetota bacterium]|nr:hypothetical protein [Planctomycetota bacterium]MDA0933069.1 hypothetical protein [Planctomycetota bacterium]MDA1221381.1 hypothetical protein [Planctomycetota bacterium]
MGTRPVLVLGPQRHVPLVREALAALGCDDDHTPVALCSAGWEERELEHDELQEHVARPVVNLEVFSRVETIYREDPELHAAVRARHDRMRRLQALHQHRLAHAVDAACGLADVPDAALDMAAAERRDAIEAIRTLDRTHLDRLRGMHEAFWNEWRPEERPAVARHREELRNILRPCAALCVAGGHVAILLNRLRLLGVLDLCPELPVVAWSAGAMALSHRVILFHDSPPQGQGNVEVFEAGLGLIGGLVPLPHAKHRLRLDDPERVSLIAERFAPDSCVALSGGEMLAWDRDRWRARTRAEVLAPSGRLEAFA